MRTKKLTADADVVLGDVDCGGTRCVKDDANGRVNVDIDVNK